MKKFLFLILVLLGTPHAISAVHIAIMGGAGASMMASRNAAMMMSRHRATGYSWTPIGTPPQQVIVPTVSGGKDPYVHLKKWRKGESLWEGCWYVAKPGVILGRAYLGDIKELAAGHGGWNIRTNSGSPYDQLFNWIRKEDGGSYLGDGPNFDACFGSKSDAEKFIAKKYGE